MKKYLLLMLLVSIILAGCSSGSQLSKSTETPTPSTTPTITPTVTSSPTSTAIPTHTPTFTPTPTPTPIGNGLGKLAYIKTVKSPLKSEQGFDLFISNIFIYDFSTDFEIQITNNEIDTFRFDYGNLNWSPNGHRLVYTTHKYTYDNGNTKYWNSIIYTMNIDGTDVRMVSTFPQYVGNNDGEDVIKDARPSFIDNERILFLSNRKNLLNFLWEPLRPYIVDMNTLEITTPFTSYIIIENLSMSPDKSKIAFMSNDAKSEIYIADLTKNGAITQITKNNFADRFPAFSPDGQWIAFHSDRDGNVELYVMRPDGSEVKRITTNPATDATASWSPDGNWLSFFSDQTGVIEAFIQNINTGEKIQITNGGNAVSYVRWAP